MTVEFRSSERGSISGKGVSLFHPLLTAHADSLNIQFKLAFSFVFPIFPDFARLTLNFIHNLWIKPGFLVFNYSYSEPLSLWNNL